MPLSLESAREIRLRDNRYSSIELLEISMELRLDKNSPRKEGIHNSILLLLKDRVNLLQLNFSILV